MKKKIGLTIIVIGVLHTLLSFVKFSGTFGEIISDGFFNSGVGAERGWAIWFMTTGIIFILLGLALNQLEQQKLHISKSIGWGLLFTAIIGGAIIPISGFWALLLPAIPIIGIQRNQSK